MIPNLICLPFARLVIPMYIAETKPSLSLFKLLGIKQSKSTLLFGRNERLIHRVPIHVKSGPFRANVRLHLQLLPHKFEAYRPQ